MENFTVVKQAKIKTQKGKTVVTKIEMVPEGLFPEIHCVLPKKQNPVNLITDSNYVAGVLKRFHNLGYKNSDINTLNLKPSVTDGQIVLSLKSSSFVAWAHEKFGFKVIKPVTEKVIEVKVKSEPSADLKNFSKRITSVMKEISDIISTSEKFFDSKSTNVAQKYLVNLVSMASKKMEFPIDVRSGHIWGMTENRGWATVSDKLFLKTKKLFNLVKRSDKETIKGISFSVVK